MQLTRIITALLMLFQATTCMELTDNNLLIGSTTSIHMFPNPTFPNMEQMQTATKNARDFLKQYSPVEIQGIIARERNLEGDAIRFESIAAKELLIKRIKEKIDAIAQLEKDKQAITIEIQKFKATAAKAKPNKIKKQIKEPSLPQLPIPPTKPQLLIPPTKPQLLIPPTKTQLLIPPTKTQLLIPPTKTQKSKLQQTVAIKRALMRANYCNTEVELKEVYFDYCERTNSRCIFKEITDHSAWHYSKKTNLLEIFISDEAYGIFHNSSSSSDD